MKRVVVIALILVAVLGLSWWGYQLFGVPKAVDQSGWTRYRVERGDLEVTVSVAGNLAPERELSLGFMTGGVVEAVFVGEGQEVTEGTLLAQLDTTELELAVQQAEASLLINQVRLTQTLEGPSAEELAAAEASYQSALANYNRLTSGPSPEDLAAAQANLDRARLALEQAQYEYDQLRARGIPGLDYTPTGYQMRQAYIDYAAAEANYKKAVGADPVAVAQAKAQLEQARSTLESLRERPKAEDVLIAQAQVEQARVALEQARANLEKARIIAPFDGVVARVDIQEGQMVGSGPAIVLINPSSYHLDVVVDEMDIGLIAEGQPVRIRVDAFPDAELQGYVARIAPAASMNGGVVGYPVRVNLYPTDIPVRSGMSASAEIVVKELTDVLLLPNRAVRVDRETGKAYVEKLVAGMPQEVEVELGERNESVVEIRSGLEEGDVVVVRPISGRERIQQTLMMEAGR